MVRPWPRTVLLTAAMYLFGPVCSSVEPVVGDGGTGAGGAAGSAGAICLGADSCVVSCADESGINNPMGACDQHGQLQCPAGSQRLSTCPEGACARFDRFCCNQTTGELTTPPCNAGGVRDACPPGSRGTPSYACIPDGLGVSNCEDLADKSCSSSSQRCRLGAVQCTCMPRDGAMTWDCAVEIL